MVSYVMTLRCGDVVFTLLDLCHADIRTLLSRMWKQFSRTKYVSVFCSSLQLCAFFCHGDKEKCVTARCNIIFTKATSSLCILWLCLWRTPAWLPMVNFDSRLLVFSRLSLLVIANAPFLWLRDL